MSARTGDGPDTGCGGKSTSYLRGKPLPHGIAAFKNSSGLVRKKEVVTEHIPV